MTLWFPSLSTPLRFAYRPNRSVDDAVAVALHRALQHLDCSRAYVGMFFLDCSSASNTTRPGKQVIMKLSRPPTATGFCSRSARHQRCLSPKLFNLYTSDCVSTRDDTVTIIKYADDTTILDLIKIGDESGYGVLVNDILVYGEENDLILTVDKTKELIMDFGEESLPPLQPINIRGTEVERVNCYWFTGPSGDSEPLLDC